MKRTTDDRRGHGRSLISQKGMYTKPKPCIYVYEITLVLGKSQELGRSVVITTVDAHGCSCFWLISQLRLTIKTCIFVNEINCQEACMKTNKGMKNSSFPEPKQSNLSETKMGFGGWSKAETGSKGVLLSLLLSFSTHLSQSLNLTRCCNDTRYFRHVSPSLCASSVVIILSSHPLLLRALVFVTACLWILAKSVFKYWMVKVTKDYFGMLCITDCSVILLWFVFDTYKLVQRRTFELFI